MGAKDIECVMKVLGNKKFLMGNVISDIDVIAYSVLQVFYGTPYQFGENGLPMEEEVNEYLERVQEIIYPDAGEGKIDWVAFHEKSIPFVDA